MVAEPTLALCPQSEVHPSRGDFELRRRDYIDELTDSSESEDDEYDSIIIVAAVV